MPLLEMLCSYIQRKDILKILVICRLFTNLLRTNICIIYIYIYIYTYIYIMYVIFKAYLNKNTIQKKLLQLRKDQMTLIDMRLETQRIYPKLCSSIRNVGILKQSLMVESLSKTSTKRRIQTFYNPTNVYSVKNFVGESISSISIWHIVKQLGKHDFSCRQIFFDIWK